MSCQANGCSNNTPLDFYI